MRTALELLRRRELIEACLQMYPYPKSWFEQQSTAKLHGMYFKGKVPAKTKLVKSFDNVTIRRIHDGERQILAENGAWEKEYL